MGADVWKMDHISSGTISRELGRHSVSRDRTSSSHLTACVVNYNGQHYLEDSLGAITTYKGKFNEILLIDNDSTDRGLEIVRDRFPDVKVIQLDKNYGPGTARNVGFASASCDRILFVDNDAILAPNCIDRLMQALDDNPQAVVAMPCVLYAHDKHTIQYDGADNHFLGLMMLHNENQAVATSTTETRRISSVVNTCFLIDAKRWGSGRPYDDTFFFIFEDHDFGLKTRLLGHEMLSVPSAYVYHGLGTEGLSLRISGKYSKARVYGHIRNRWQIILKNYSLKTLLLLSPILWVYEIFQLAGLIKKGWFGVWVKACVWIGLHFREILRKRRMVQKFRKTPDRELLKGGRIPLRKEFTKSPFERMGRNLLDCLAAAYWKKIEKFI